MRSERPFAPAEDGNRFSVPGDGVDVQALIADHEILVDHGVVDAHGTAFLQGFLLMCAKLRKKSLSAKNTPFIACENLLKKG